MCCKEVADTHVFGIVFILTRRTQCLEKMIQQRQSSWLRLNWVRILFSWKLWTFQVIWEPLAARESDHMTVSNILGNRNWGQGYPTMRFCILLWGNSDICPLLKNYLLLNTVSLVFTGLNENPKKGGNSMVCNSASQSSKTHVQTRLPFCVRIWGSDSTTLFSRALYEFLHHPKVWQPGTFSFPSLPTSACLGRSQETGILAWLSVVQHWGSLCRAQCNSVWKKWF